ncbi:MAG TPA: glycine zipper 2TM domain-containing protein [Casimicrobiaceae bacterium]
MTRTFRHSIAAAFAMMLLSSSQVALAQSKCTSTTCGVIDRVELVEKKGQGSGLGLIAGGVVGGVLGHQIGSGRGNTAATILGAGAGAYAGNEVEKNAKKSSYWSVAIRMDNGQMRNFTYTNQPPVHEGERVRLIDSGRRLARVSG